MSKLQSSFIVDYSNYDKAISDFLRIKSINK